MDALNNTEILSSQFKNRLSNTDVSGNDIIDIVTQFEKKYRSIAYTYVLSFLTQLDFIPEEAKSHWFDILRHQIRLEKSLARQVGLRVTACDYFINIKPKFRNMLFIEADTISQKTTLALTDELTGLNNRRYFNQMLNKEIEYSKRYDHPFSLLIVDLDYFKEYNDKHGHTEGDSALIILANCLLNNSRTIDHITRYGGDEFTVILPQTNKDEGIIVAERLRDAIEKLSFPGEDDLSMGKLTVSIGLSTFPADGLDAVEIFKKADEALYRAKARKNEIYGWRRDLRESVRYPFFEKLLYRTYNSTGGFQVGDVIDISAGGMQFHGAASVEPGLKLDISIKHPKSNDQIAIQATVAHLSKIHSSEGKYRMGISFELSPEDSQKMEDLLSWVATR